jgi:hypothetical protein
LWRSPDDGSSVVDITRVQMLPFTLLCAGFVVVTVAVTYVIPEISPSYQILLSISNGVYLGRKLTG